MEDWRQMVIEALSTARMNPYLERCNGNRKAALNLYRWHGELTAAVQTVLGNTEVVLPLYTGYEVGYPMSNYC